MSMTANFPMDGNTSASRPNLRRHRYSDTRKQRSRPATCLHPGKRDVAEVIDRTASTHLQDTPSVLLLEGITYSYPTPNGTLFAHNPFRKTVAAPILKDISFEVRAGETLALMGSSGVGKTTLLRIIAGLIAPTTGTRRTVAQTMPQREDGNQNNDMVTMVFQDYPAYPWLSVEKNIQFGAYARPRAERAAYREYAQWLMEQVGLKPFRHHLPAQLSGGMRQRLSIAQALASRPALLLMDEPFSALDLRTKEEIIALLQRLQKEIGFAMTLTLHSLEDAYQLADRVLVLGGQPAQLRKTLCRKELSQAALKNQVLAAMQDDESGMPTQQSTQSVQNKN